MLKQLSQILKQIVSEVEVNGLRMACKTINQKTFSNNLDKARQEFLSEVDKLLNIVSPSTALFLGISTDKDLCILQELING